MKVLNKKCIAYVIVSKYSLTIKLTKKEKILQTALDLFANEGFNAVSTRRIADAAGVSEGLIFRHFESKKGLLSIIMEQAENRIQEIFHSILLSIDPTAVIRDTINLVFTVDQEEYDFWRLQYKLKWQKEYYNPEKMKERDWLHRIIFLETVAGVPGMIGGMVRHLKSLRSLEADHGWIHHLLQEAENERMHLFIFLSMYNPGIFFRMSIAAA